MQIKSIMTALILALSATGCSTVSKVVYRIDVPQGNYLEAGTVSQLQAGMTRQQVQYLLGTPVLQNPFEQHTWYYVFLQQKGYETPQQHMLVINFNPQGLVSDFKLDKPLTEDEKQIINNSIISAPPQPAASWWQFWK
ncbi:Beta-barrel assembly machine subunit BamE [Mesocricetibacter intestinalis]|uniref:Outer membrane protein assembly factor BamE n=1 Tax=Mesocricetibacter intestinalis TaxID=1521930 RepID=A0A4R6VC80_9PAST|nr:outer membrane protein assembly factor BamE [Mesocricetibacter intestinalis]TDQ59516.1 Beta-barrel assembly machine subunit BamE [Mesocricetibacter intestinalis]